MNYSIKGLIAAVIGLLLIAAVPFCVEWVDAKHIMVVQYPTGTIRVFTEPGPAPEWFGTTTKYLRRAQFEFDANRQICKSAADDAGAPPMRVRFAEGGHGHICGKLNWEMPAKHESIVELQKDFGSQRAIEQSLIATSLTNAIYLAGQTMTSQESSAERRSDLLSTIEDQLKEGVYRTASRQVRDIDPVTKQERTITVVEILKGSDGRPLRSNVSAIKQYGIQIVQTSISEIPYDKEVEEQIKQTQNARARVQISITNAIAAEQDTRTVAEQGKATAAKAEWEQKTIAAREVEKARQEKLVAETHAAKLKEVARYEKEAADFTKQKDILLGQGESERRRLVMSADGALEKKLEALVTINGQYAAALKDYQGAWVPHTVMGGSGNGTVNGGMALIDLLTAKTARDLQLDMSVSKK